MKTLTVTLNYALSEYSPPTARQPTLLALPLRVLDADGSVVAQGAVSSHLPKTFDLSNVSGPAFVRLTWPSGKTETQRVNFSQDEDAQITFSDGRISHNEWSAWAVPRLSKKTSVAKQETSWSLRIDRFDRVWLTLWTFDNGQWLPSAIPSGSSYRNDWARQLDFDFRDRKCRMLQLGSATLPWRLVSLPSGGACRVLLAPNESIDPRSERLTVVVTGFRLDAETLLEFLSRDAMREASAMASFGPLAQQLLEEKVTDPVSAIAAAYFLLRTSWMSIPLQWFINLTYVCSWLADPLIILCAVRIRAGLSATSDRTEVLSQLKQSLSRGVPLFAESLALLQEVSSALRLGTDAKNDSVFQDIETLVASQAWSGAALSFYGQTPSRPSPERMVGMPGQGRPAKKATRISVAPDLYADIRGASDSPPQPQAYRETLLGYSEGSSVRRVARTAAKPAKKAVRKTAKKTAHKSATTSVGRNIAQRAQSAYDPGLIRIALTQIRENRSRNRSATEAALAGPFTLLKDL